MAEVFNPFLDVDHAMILTLQSQEEIRRCRDRLLARGLDFTQTGRLGIWPTLYRLRYRTRPPAVDIMKSWDVANAVQIIEQTITDPRSPILDMGCFNSEILYALHAIGYQRLYGCDLNPLCRWMPFWHRIRYCSTDLTCTSYADRSFAAVTCISVIEHGVSSERLLQEVTRLLRPNGVFIFTTDYDATPQRHERESAVCEFGLTWKIFTPEGLSRLIASFINIGFSLMDPEQLQETHSACPISWHGQEYTFALVALRAPG